MDSEKHEVEEKEESRIANLSVRQTNKVIRRLRLEDHDVILIKSGTEMAKNNNMDALAEAVGKTGVEGIIVVVVDSLNDVSTLNTNAMQKHGWYKFKDAAALLMDRYHKEKTEDKPEEQEVISDEEQENSV